VCLLFLLCSTDVRAQSSTPTFQQLNIEHGLSQATVHAIAQDSLGFIWLGTADGLDRYDGFSVTNYFREAGRPGSLSHGRISALYVDRQGGLWAGTRGGLNRYSWSTGSFDSFHHDPRDPTSLRDGRIDALAGDASGAIWVGTPAGLDRLDPEDGRVERFPSAPGRPDAPPEGGVSALLQATNGVLWAGFGNRLVTRDPQDGAFRPLPLVLPRETTVHVTTLHQDPIGHIWVGTTAGLFQLDSVGTLIRHLSAGAGMDDSLADDWVLALASDDDGGLWIGTPEGLSRFDPASERMEHHRHEAGNPYSLSHDRAISLMTDRAGGVWVGTYSGGASRMNPTARYFRTYQHNPADLESLSHNTVWGVMEDRSGALWVGTDQGLNRMDPGSDRFTRFRHDPTDPSSIPHDQVWTMAEDPSGTIWIGTQIGLAEMDPATGRVTRNPLGTAGSLLQGQVVYSLLAEPDGTLWVGSGSELFRIDPAREAVDRFAHDPENERTLTEGLVSAMVRDRRGTLWVGTPYGLSRLDPSTGFVARYRHDPVDARSLPADAVQTVFEDRSGRIWVGTMGGGLSRFDEESEVFETVTRSSGLPNNTVYCILEDEASRLWLSTNRGLVRFDPLTGEVAGFRASDGLQGEEFSGGACTAAESGEVFFGGISGLTGLDPALLPSHREPPPIVLTEFLVAGAPVNPSDPDGILPRHVNQAGEVTLPHTVRGFAIEFAAPGSGRPDQDVFSYRMDGFDDGWTETTPTHRRATYTNLPPGSYSFLARAGTPNGQWSPDPARLDIRILPPPWRTPWAYAIYLLLGGVLVGGAAFLQRRELLRERSVTGQLRELDRLKDTFLANTSHELRTPLHGIVGLAESLRDGAAGAMSEKADRNLAMIVASGKRLAGLVDGILDFSRIRHDALELDLRPVQVRPLVDLVMSLTAPLVNQEAVELVNGVPEGLPPVLADEDRLFQILHNLLGNAAKFTDEGKIRMSAEAAGNEVIVKVEDTGIGIPTEQVTLVFEPFIQAGPTRGSKAGTGLGLAITRQLVEAHGGRITVQSEPGVGSTFEVALPIAAPGLNDVQGRNTQTLAGRPGVAAPVRDRPLEPFNVAQREEAQSRAGGHGARLLVVDDDEVNREVLLNHLGVAGYDAVAVGDGAQALAALSREDFDGVLLDVMMPGLSGFQTCERIRARYAMHELPVVFLTGRAQDVDLASGFDAGGNDYLVKPVAKAELLARLELHLRLSRLSRELEAHLGERTEEVKILGGLLPICSFCKRIRDDGGYWERLESYISQRTEALFSHSLCPECMVEHYGEFCQDDDPDIPDL
jgi:two-component system, sensor histidine kinase ChiS